MAALLLVLTVVAGIGLGVSRGGSVERLTRWRPLAWQALAAGLILQVPLRLGFIGGGWATALDLLSTIGLAAFAVANIRTGGMVLVLAGLAFNFVPTLLNWGMPTSRAALETAGLVEIDGDARLVLDGARHVATDDDLLRFLGEVIPLPTHQVISFGDLLLHIGYALVLASIVRGRTVRRNLPGSYPDRIAPLGRGPARRRGPGLHPSRLSPRGYRPSPRDRTPGS